MKTKFKTVILSHSKGLSSHGVAWYGWDWIWKEIVNWGVYCERLGVKPDKPRIRLYHG